MRTRRYCSIAVVGVAAAILASCGSGNDDADVSQTSLPTSTPSTGDKQDPTPVDTPSSGPTTTATTPAPQTTIPTEQEPDVAENTAAETAEQAVLDFLAVSDELFAEPDTSLDVLDSVAVGRSWREVQDSVQDARSAGRTRNGTTTVTDFEVIDHELDPEQPDNGFAPRRMVLRGCLIAHTGDEVYFQFELHDLSETDSHDWRVATDEPVFTDDDPPEPTPCP